MTFDQEHEIASILSSRHVAPVINSTINAMRSEINTLKITNNTLGAQLDAANLKLKEQPENARLFGFTKRPSVIILLASPRELHMFNDEKAATLFAEANSDRLGWALEINPSTPFTWHSTGDRS